MQEAAAPLGAPCQYGGSAVGRTEKTPGFTGVDAAFACGFLAVGWLFWELQLWSGWRWFGNAGTGTALFTALFAGAVLAYVYLAKLRPPRESWFWLAVLLCLGLGYALPYGGGLVLVPLVAAFCSDSAALFTGMACGKHKLSPLVSPHKTVEGAVGGLVGGVLGMVIFRIIFYLCTLQPLHIGGCILMGLVGALMGQLGDLSFSAIKRQYGLKDYGRLLPGHGGVLDRFDSVLFAAPVLWLMTCWVIGL